MVRLPKPRAQSISKAAAALQLGSGVPRMQALIDQQTDHPQWGQHAQRIASGEMWDPPGNGGNNDQAHPPIHPTKPCTGALPSGWWV